MRRVGGGGVWCSGFSRMKLYVVVGIKLSNDTKMPSTCLACDKTNMVQTESVRRTPVMHKNGGWGAESRNFDVGVHYRCRTKH